MPPPPTPNPNPQTFFSTVLNPAANNPPTTTSTTTPPRPHPRPTASGAATTTAQPQPFTATQRSLQARGKPYATPAAGEAYETRQQREQAANILSSTELLLWYSAARNESLSQTRHYFQNILLGLPPPTSQWVEEYDVPPEQRARTNVGDVAMSGSGNSPARPGKGKGKERERERERGKRKS